MPPLGNMPSEVRKTLVQLGVERVADIERIRDCLTEMAGLGTPLLPEFTLHNQVHSDNLVRLLARLKKEFGLKLSSYEAFLLTASAYLHDVGMFFDGGAFQEDILPDPVAALSFCPQGLCDTPENYQLFGLDTGAQLRETHSLLSAYLLYQEETHIDGVMDEDRPFLMAICRGHGRANLRERGCWCYRTIPQDGEEIRVGLLASLLRLVDAMDFHKNRAPAKILGQRAVTFLKTPVSLGHWIKQYFVLDPFVARINEGGNLILRCTVYFSVPTRKLNGVRYLDFFRPLFEKHVEEARKWNFDINEYPSDLAIALGINDIELVLEERELPGGRDLPTRIVEEIERTSCGDVLEFLEQRARATQQDATTGVEEGFRCKEVGSAPLDLPSEPVLIVEDHPWYRKHLGSILTGAGYQCELAETFEEALEKLNVHDPFVLLLDMKLHGSFQKGWALARAALDRGVPVIVVTSYPSIEGINGAIREFDVAYFFDKAKLSPEQLRSRVSEVAGRPRRKKLSRSQRQVLLERLLGFFPDSTA